MTLIKSPCTYQNEFHKSMESMDICNLFFLFVCLFFNYYTCLSHREHAYKFVNSESRTFEGSEVVLHSEITHPNKPRGCIHRYHAIGASNGDQGIKAA